MHCSWFRDDSPKRKKTTELTEAEKHKLLLLDRNSNVKLRLLKLVLFIITCCTIVTLLWSRAFHNELLSQSNPWSHIAVVSSKWEKTTSDPRYVSHVDINWEQMPNILNNLLQGNQRVGLLNFNYTEVDQWHKRVPEAETLLIDLEYADQTILWSDLYPEYIDEDEENGVPACPSLPEPHVKTGTTFDLIAVKLPCNRSGAWSKDVPRLHLQLAAAKLAVSSTKQKPSPYVLFVTDCFPVPNLFSCNTLIKREGNAWLFKPSSTQLQQKHRLPIGSCQLAVHLKQYDGATSVSRNREAYVTILHSVDNYVCGAIAVAQSIRFSGSTRDLVILVDNSISNHHRTGLEAAGWKVRVVERIRNPKAEKNAYNEWNYSKFRLWQLTDYDKIIFVDADVLIMKNIDFLFSMPEMSAAENNAEFFNSGVMVIEPSNCTFQLLMDNINEITSNNGGDQGYLNEIFTWWHRIPMRLNFLKFSGVEDTERIKMNKKMYTAEPPELYALHFLGLKPWMCFRDYDCNFNSDLYMNFVSDEAHAVWWKFHEKMPENLQSFCLLSSFRKAHLEFNRRKAEENKFIDRHWQLNITDPRKDICFESYCDWTTILARWEDKVQNQTAT